MYDKSLKTKQKTTLSGIVYCLMSKGVRTKTTAAVIPRGSERGNPTMTTSMITAMRKGDPQHYVEGKNKVQESCLKNHDLGDGFVMPKWEA